MDYSELKNMSSEEVDRYLKNKQREQEDFKRSFEDLQTEVKELKARGGRFAIGGAGQIKGLRDAMQASITKAIIENKEAFAAVQNGGKLNPIEFKTVGAISSSNLSGDNYQSYIDWQPGMEPTGQFHFRNLVRTIPSATDFVQFPRANTPIGEGSFGKQATEGDLKSQVDRDYTMIDVTLKPTAAFTIVSRQALRNIIFLQNWLPSSLMNSLEETEDQEFANTLVAAATGSTTTSKTALPEKLISYMKTLIKAKYNPNGIAVDPDVWEDLLTYRPGTDNPYSLPGPVTISPDGTIRLLNRPVYPVNWLTGRRIIVGDWTKAAIVQSEGMTLRQSDSHSDLFGRNQVAFLVERIEDLAIFRPEAFITTTV